MPDSAPPAHGADDRPIRWRRNLVLAALGPFAYGLQTLATQSPETTERIYSLGIYPWVQAGLTAIAQLSPFALGEALLLGSIVWILLRCAGGCLGLWRRQRRLGNLLQHAVAQTLAVAGVLFFLFQVLWALNHARLPFATQVALQPAPVESARLARVARKLAERAAAARPPELDAGEPFLPANWRDAIGDAYEAAGAQWPVLAGPRPAIRQAWISPLMTLGSITGIYSPFTGEPNVNVDIPEIVRPFVGCHEVAHLRGYAREDEANFIAWWVGSRAKDRAIAYSCELLAYRYAMQTLRATNSRAWLETLEQTPKAVREDDAAIDSFWRSRPMKAAAKVVTAITTKANDVYLKSSGHTDGVRSYGRMVDLLIASLDP
jgi:truncated hemoglobin YjbI